MRRENDLYNELFENCSKMLIYGTFIGGASAPKLGSGRTLNHLQKTIYSPLYISLPSIGYARRGDI
jgi:hypothetical protein